MARRFAGDRLVIATHNQGKLAEMAALVAPFGVSAVSAGALGLPEPEETGDSFEANAELKALAATRASALPALADDSGLVVPALGGAPGIYSARWAGPERDFARAMALVEERLGDSADRRGSFVAVLSLAWPDGHVESFRGEVHGSLVFPPRGARGFGYDPIFVPTGGSESFGEMDPAAKHAMSHRATAFRQLARACFSG
ncbi:MAG TPA: RdgB/HAM1 family non-canonical purine NTP pyrophosphatase [Stellaceae bacterium]|nr:RdgB/HAM1 family non-canonical purine NTP pyrophosphatase [Stellaceae bacterium]